VNQPPRQVDVDLARNKAQAAQLALAGAQDKLDQVRRGPDASAIDSARLGVDRAKSALTAAQGKQSAAKAGPTDAQMATAVAGVESARSAVTSANAKLAEVNSHPTPAELRDAQDRITVAQSALTRAVTEATGGSVDGTDTGAADYLLLQTNIESDRTQVALLEKEVNDSRLRAPSSGIVTGVAASPGDTVLPARAVMSIARPGDPVVQLEATDKEAARLSIGQDVVLKVDNLDDVKPLGSVTAIADRETGSGKLVTVAVAWPESRIQYGVSAEATFSVDQHDDALVVPEKAIRSNGARKYVEYMEGTSRRAVDVQVGITSGGFVEILKGLSEGQTVLVRP